MTSLTSWRCFDLQDQTLPHLIYNYSRHLLGHHRPPNINLEKLFRLDSCHDHIAKTEGTLNGHISSTHCHAGRVSQEKNLRIYIAGIQGLVADPPNLSLSQECLSTFEQELLGQLYNVFLILVKAIVNCYFLFNLLPSLLHFCH